MAEIQENHNQSLLSDNTITQVQEQKQIFELTPLQKLLDKVGGEGKYQFNSFLIFNAMWFLASWMLVGQGFFFDDTYQCKGITDQKECKDYICKLEASKRPEAMESHANSIIFAFEGQFLICEDGYLEPVLTSLLYLGSLLGFFVIPYVADNWGRKIAMRISWGVFVFGLLAIGIADSPNMIGLGQLLSGFGLNPAITLCYSFINEQVLREKRQIYGVVIQIALAIGECTIAFMFMPDYSWRVVIFILLGLVVVNWITLGYLIESPKFLIDRSKKQTLSVLNEIAKRNHKSPLQYSEIEQISSADSEQSQTGSSLMDLFRYNSLRKITIAGGVVFMAIQVVYYGTILNLNNLGYGKLVNQEMVGLSEGFGYFAAEVVISKILRKKWSFFGMGGAAVLCFVLAISTALQNDNNEKVMKVIETIGLILNRFVLCAFWALFYVYVAQLYPTKVRSIGFGWVSMMGTVGSTLAPYMIYFSIQTGINSWIPPAVFGVLGFLSIFLLKETYKKPLFDDIEEVRLKKQNYLSSEQDENNQ